MGHTLMFPLVQSSVNGERVTIQQIAKILKSHGNHPDYMFSGDSTSMRDGHRTTYPDGEIFAKQDAGFLKDRILYKAPSYMHKPGEIAFVMFEGNDRGASLVEEIVPDNGSSKKVNRFFFRLTPNGYESMGMEKASRE